MNMQSKIESMLRHLAVGDALGKICSKYTKEDVDEIYGGPITRLVKPIRRTSKQEWRKGSVTDDTILTLLVADSLVEKGKFDRKGIARKLISCDPRGGTQIYKLKSSGNYDYCATDGYTNGASIRVSPLAAVNKDLRELTDNVRSLSTLTHGTSESITAALMVAYSLNYFIGDKKGETLRSFLENAAIQYYPSAKETRVYEKLQTAFEIANSTCLDELADALEAPVGYFKESWSSVPTAVVLGAMAEKSHPAILQIIHRNLPGGDLDSVASIAGSIMGARQNDSAVYVMSREIEESNNISFSKYAENLTKLRGDLHD